MAVEVSVTTTPNENALKFNCSQSVLESGYKTYNDAEKAAESPVAAKIFATDGVASVFLMPDFITVTKKPEASWETIQPATIEAIKSTL
jgi:hypothetical protein